MAGGTLEGFTRLKRRFTLATLSNGNVALIVNMARRAGLPWDAILGAEVARAYKPAAEAYDCAARSVGPAPAQCLMVAAHPCDLTPAAKRGFRTAYVTGRSSPARRPPRRERGRAPSTWRSTV